MASIGHSEKKPNHLPVRETIESTRSAIRRKPSDNLAESPKTTGKRVRQQVRRPEDEAPGGTPEGDLSDQPSRNTRRRPVRVPSAKSSKLLVASGEFAECAVRTGRSQPTIGPVKTSRSSQLQGFTPLTSPWQNAAVARNALLDPSMGFVSPPRSSSSRINPAFTAPENSRFVGRNRRAKSPGH
jgi:hypothetical protein